MFAIFKRELAAYFNSPVGYVVAAAFMMFNGIFLYRACLSEGTSNMYSVFISMYVIVIFLIPLITMRLFSEDRKNRTDQALITSPVRISSIVIAKFLSALALLTICLMGYIVDGVILSFIGSPDWGVIVGNIFAMMLIGSALIAIGIFISSLTESIITAAVFSFAANILINLIETVSNTIPWEWLKNLLLAFSFQTRYSDFSLGIISFSAVVFFITVCGLFLFLTDRVIDRRRWA